MNKNKIDATENSGVIIQGSSNTCVDIINADPGKLKNIFTSNPPNFGTNPIGRKKLINDAKRILRKEHLLVLMGMGGIGKTKIAKEIYYNAKGYRYKGWVNYSEEKGMSASVVDAIEFMCGLNFPEKSSVEQKFSILESTINGTSGKVLLVVDNINVQSTEENGINRLYGLGNCDVIITSRCRLTNDERTKEVGFIDEKDCQKLFYRYYEYEKDDVKSKEIIKLAGYHTMTVELLAKIADTARMKLADFAQKLKAQTFDMRDIVEKAKTEWDNETTEKTLSEHIEKLFAISVLSEDEKKLLGHVSIITKSSIKKADAREILGLRGYTELNGLIDKGWLMQTQASDEPSLQMHPVIWNSVQNQYNVELDDKVLNIISRIAKLIDCDNKGYYGDVVQYIPLAVSVFMMFEMYFAGEIGQLSHNIARVCIKLGKYKLALGMFKVALINSVTILGEKHPNTAITYTSIASAYCMLDDYENALLFFEKASELYENELSDKYENKASNYSNLAFLYGELEEYDKAIEQYEKAIEIKERRLGSDCFELVATYCGVAGLNSKLKEYENAISFYIKAIDICKNTVGIEHSETAAVYNGLASVYLEQGKNEIAFEFYNKALIIYEKILGKDHPDTAIIYNNIGRLYSRQKKYYKALNCLEKSVEIFEKKLGKKHLSTATTYFNIGGVYCEKKDYDSALEYMIKGLRVYASIISKEHPRIENALITCKAAYLAAGRPESEFDTWLKEQLGK